MKPGNIQSKSIVRSFDALTRLWHGAFPLAPFIKETLREVSGNIHYYNFALWHEEDEARRTDVPDLAIAKNKRAIDRYNQLRNNAIERMDEVLLGSMGSKAIPQKGARQNSETAGSMADRMSIMTLKIYHMAAETKRTDARADHIASCRAKLAVLKLQRADLARCFDELFSDFKVGRRYFKVYRQYKMYNDPNLNPALYGNKK